MCRACSSFNLPCQHSLMHFIQMIWAFGAPNGLCSSITELKHIKAVKKPYQRSSHYEALSQMLLTNQHLDKLAAGQVNFQRFGMLSRTCLSHTLQLIRQLGKFQCIFKFISFWPTYYTAWTGADPDEGDGKDGTIAGDGGDENNNGHDDNEGSDEDEDNGDDRDDKDEDDEDDEDKDNEDNEDEDDEDNEDKDDGSIHAAVLADVFLAKTIGTYPKPINFSTLICLTM